MASLFTKIIKGEIPGKIVHQDEHCAVLVDIQPQAPHHYLVIPKKEITSIATGTLEDQAIFGHLLLVAGKIARDKGLDKAGYRLVINTGDQGGQTVPHLHIHLLGGRQMTWPPG
ncbi:MAG: histidine triad nucleotide-binding protein [Bdellovibrionales bacterium]